MGDGAIEVNIRRIISQVGGWDGGRIQAEHPVELWLVWGLALKGQTVRSGTREGGGSWKEDVLHGKEFRFYPSGSGEGLHDHVCILQGSPQLLCRDWPGGARGARGAAIWEAARSRPWREVDTFK